MTLYDDVVTDGGCTMSAGLDWERVSAVGDRKSEERLARELNGIAFGTECDVEIDVVAVVW